MSPITRQGGTFQCQIVRYLAFPSSYLYPTANLKFYNNGKVFGGKYCLSVRKKRDTENGQSLSLTAKTFQISYTRISFMISAAVACCSVNVPGAAGRVRLKMVIHCIVNTKPPTTRPWHLDILVTAGCWNDTLSTQCALSKEEGLRDTLISSSVFCAFKKHI